MGASTEIVAGIAQEDWARLMDKVYGATNKLEGTLQDHAKETRDALANLDRSVAVTTSKIEGVSAVVKPIPEQIARLEIHVDTLHEGEMYHRTQMTAMRSHVTNLELKVARVDTAPSPSIWDGPTFKYVLILAVTVITGLLALAGYQMPRT